jgi:RNA recognition motif-containing protein
MKENAMAKRLYVENLPPDITAERLKNIFDQVGEVQSVRIKTDYLTIRPKCSGVVDMALDVDAYRVVKCFEGATFKNGRIHLKEEDPRMEKARLALTDIADSYERVSTKFVTDFTDGYERVSTKLVTDFTDGYERVSTKLAKEVKDIEKKIEDKIEEMKKR